MIAAKISNLNSIASVDESGPSVCEKLLRVHINNTNILTRSHTFSGTGNG